MIRNATKVSQNVLWLAARDKFGRRSWKASSTRGGTGDGVRRILSGPGAGGCLVELGRAPTQCAASLCEKSERPWARIVGLQRENCSPSHFRGAGSVLCSREGRRLPDVRRTRIRHRSAACCATDKMCVPPLERMPQPGRAAHQHSCSSLNRSNKLRSTHE